MKKTLAVLAMAILSFCSAFTAVAADLEKSLAHDLAECSRIVRGLKTSGAISPEMLGRLKSIAETLKADRLLLAERQAAISQIAGPLGSKAPERQGKVSSELLTKLDELLTRLEALPAIPSAADLETLKALLKALGTQKSRPLLGALPYRHLGYPASEPATAPVILPAYKGGDRTVVSADTAASPEAPVTKEIAELAQSLQWNPVLIYEWVKNNIQTEWYWGVMKGAEETLRQKSGNDADQAALLVALLRSGGFPARFVKGTIEFFPDIERAKNLTGLDDPARIAAFLQKAGIPYKAVIRGGGIANFQVEHIWVEAFIPYANYRGAVMDYQGKVWIGLDTSIKTKGYERVSGGGVPAAMLDTLREDYLAAPQSLAPLDYLAKKLDEQLASSQPGTTWKDLQDRAAIIPDVLKILPAGLQFTQTALTGEYQTLPDALKHTLVFTATSNNNELLSYTVETHKLAGKRLALRYEPESTEDQNTINSFGGLDSTPPYLVRLRPVLTLDGERLVVGQDGLPMGESYTLQIDVVTPAGRERISSSQISGNLSVIAVAAQKAPAPAALSENDDAELILHKEAIGYINRWDKSEDDLAALLGQTVSRPTVSLAVVGAQIETTTLLDVVHDFRWKGLFLDAAYRRIETVGRDGKERDFMRLSALQGSILENRIFEDDLKVDSISTAKLLQAATAGGTAPLRIDKTTVSSILPTLPFDEAVISDIANAVNQGLVVIIPSAETTYFEWSGTGYIKEDPLSGESGWMLSGQVAGGMTVWAPEKWDTAEMQKISDILRAPLSGKPNYKIEEAVKIEKIPIRDQQVGTVGEQIMYPLQVKVTDSVGRQVKGASVIFAIKAGGGNFSDNSNVFRAKTDYKGLAKAPLILGKKTSDNPVYWFKEGNTYSDQYGENIVDAKLDNGTTIDTPFTAYGKPGSLAKLRPTYGMNIQGMFLSYGGFVALVAEDGYGNPIANQKVVFKLGQTMVTGSCKDKTHDTTPALLVKGGDDCLNKSPSISDASLCKNAATTITDTTSSSGAWAGLILGGAPGATYPVTVTAVYNNKIFTAQYAPSSFDLLNCSDNVEPKAQLFIGSIIPVDMYGKNINAAKSGSKISIMARQYLIREGETTMTENLACSGGTLPCPKIVGDHTYGTTTSFVNSTVNIDKVAARDIGNGLFLGGYALKPGLNTVAIEGNASYNVKRYANSCGSGCAQEAATEVRTLNSASAIQVYGVDIAVNQPLNIMLDGQGLSRFNLKIKYTITPADYQASNALILLYKVAEQNGIKNYELIDNITVEKQGEGYGVIARGYKFEENQNYAVQVALNYGSGVEIRSDKAPIIFAKGALIPDYNHNLKIDQEDYERALNNDTYHFWVNDDDDQGDTVGKDIPGADTKNAMDPVIKGTRDLVDWFPVYLDIKSVVEKYNPTTYRYEFRSANATLKFVYTDLSATTSGTYLTDVPTALSMVGKACNEISSISDLTNILTPNFINTVTTQGKGIVLIEGTAQTTSPLYLDVYDTNNKIVFRSQLNLSIADVEQMFRHVNLVDRINNPKAPAIETDKQIGKNKAEGGERDRFSSPNLPDSETDAKYTVMVHGFKVGGQAARGWHSEFFKRLYWSGSRARFVGVTWFGNESIPDYHQNVVNAFSTAKVFGQNVVNTTGNAPVTLIAHSLGNMVVSSYLNDHYQASPLNITNYFLVNAAVPLEAYLGDYNQFAEGEKLYEPFNSTDANGEMVHPYWDGYHKRLAATEWYKLFSPPDQRSGLTWRNRFSSMPESITYHNYYSTDEDVLATHTGEPGAFEALINVIFNNSQYSWAFQEKWKGRAPKDGKGGTTTMGWGFSKSDYLDRQVPAPANSTITSGMLKEAPFFDKTVPDGVPADLYGANKVVDLATGMSRDKLLSKAIPALTLPAGGWKGEDISIMDKYSRNTVDMNTNKNGWPSTRTGDNDYRWRHSDIREIAYPFVYMIFNRLAQ